MSATPSPRQRPGPITGAAAALGSVRNRVHIVVTPQQVGPLTDTAEPQVRPPRLVEWPAPVPQSGSGLRVTGSYEHDPHR